MSNETITFGNPPHGMTWDEYGNPVPLMENNKNDFQVYTLIMEEDEAGYTHWAEGLTMYIVKDGVTIKLDGNEVQQLVKALPRTLGGTY